MLLNVSFSCENSKLKGMLSSQIMILKTYDILIKTCFIKPQSTEIDVNGLIFLLLE